MRRVAGMTNAGKPKIVKVHNVEKELRKITKLFAGFEKDKSMPSFPDFFIQCLITGTAERVNLKVMYPKIYARLSKELEKHDTRIRLRP